MARCVPPILSRLTAIFARGQTEAPALRAQHHRHRLATRDPEPPNNMIVHVILAQSLLPPADFVPHSASSLSMAIPNGPPFGASTSLGIRYFSRLLVDLSSSRSPSRRRRLGNAAQNCPPDPAAPSSRSPPRSCLPLHEATISYRGDPTVTWLSSAQGRGALIRLSRAEEPTHQANTTSREEGQDSI